MTFGERIKQARIRSNKTLEEFSSQCDLSFQFLHRVESNEAPFPPAKLKLLAKALNRSYDLTLDWYLKDRMDKLIVLIQSKIQNYESKKCG